MISMEKISSVLTSTIIIGGINAIAQLGYLSFISYDVDAGDVELKINNTECAELQIILNTLLVQFLSIEESYPKKYSSTGGVKNVIKIRLTVIRF